MPVKPKSNKSKMLAGNPGKRPLAEPIRGEVGIPDMPVYFNGRESYYWEFYTKHLAARGDLDKADGPALADMCVCLARLEEAEEIIRTGGLMVQGDRGMVKNGAIQLSRNYRQQAQKWVEMFGVCIAARGRLNIPEADDENDGDFAPKRVNDYVGEAIE